MPTASVPHRPDRRPVVSARPAATRPARWPWPARPPRHQPPCAGEGDLVPAMDRLPMAGPARLLSPLAHRPPPLRPLGRRRHPGTAARGAVRSGTRGRRPRGHADLPYAKGRAVLVPVQFAGGLTSNASSSTNETKHPAEGSQVWTRVRDSWWLVSCLRISSCSRSPVVIRLGGKSVEEDVHPLRTWGVTLGVQGVVACGWMWRMPGGGSVRS
jgi:hypothetical protein